MRDLSEDYFYGGRLVVRQHRDGYRFSIDAALLAGFADAGADARVVDLGCGCGIIALLMAYRNRSCRVVGVEIQPGMVALARDNVASNRMEDRVTILEEDVRQLQRRNHGTVDLVVANPPYRPTGSGRVNPDGERACARHEILGTLDDFVAAGRRFAGPRRAVRGHLSGVSRCRPDFHLAPGGFGAQIPAPGSLMPGQRRSADAGAGRQKCRAVAGGGAAIVRLPGFRRVQPGDRRDAGPGFRRLTGGRPDSR